MYNDIKATNIQSNVFNTPRYYEKFLFVGINKSKDIYLTGTNSKESINNWFPLSEYNNTLSWYPVS